MHAGQARSMVRVGEPDAWKHARLVRREVCRDRLPQRSTALHTYSTRALVAREYDGSKGAKAQPQPSHRYTVLKEEGSLGCSVALSGRLSLLDLSPVGHIITLVDVR